MIDVAFFRGERRHRRIAADLEDSVFDYGVAKQDSWYEALLELRAHRRITSAQLRGELTSILVSSLSLSAALSSTLLCLAARPEYRDRIAGTGAMARCFVNEVLRFYPPFRQFGYQQTDAHGACQVTRSVSTDFIITTYALHRNKHAWAEADIFQPERFLEPKATAGHRFLPFGMGRRACAGRTFATQVLVETVKYVCSEASAVSLRLPEDFVGDIHGMPLGAPGRLISFPVDDRILCSSTRPSAAAR